MMGEAAMTNFVLLHNSAFSAGGCLLAHIISEVCVDMTIGLHSNYGAPLKQFLKNEIAQAMQLREKYDLFALVKKFSL